MYKKSGYAGVDMLCAWTLREQYRKFLTPNHVDQEIGRPKLDGKMEFSKISGIWTSGTGGIWV
jgi:hypothetical protein